jgi:hypothetical protein
VCLGIEFREDIITLADCHCDSQGMTIMAEDIYEGGERGAVLRLRTHPDIFSQLK